MTKPLAVWAEAAATAVKRTKRGNRQKAIGEVSKRTEHAEAVTLMKAVRMHEGRHPELRLLFAVPNGGDRHPAVASKLKAEGCKPGVPDYFLPVARGPFHGLFLELKSQTGSASREQKLWIAALRSEGYAAHVCRGWEESLKAILDYLETP